MNGPDLKKKPYYNGKAAGRCNSIKRVYTEGTLIAIGNCIDNAC
jgi:hypothetical protein